MTTPLPPDIQKQIEEVAEKKAAKLSLTINLHCKEYRLAIIKEALTEITQPLLERVEKLETNNKVRAMKLIESFCEDCGRTRNEENQCGHCLDIKLTELSNRADDLYKDFQASQQQITKLEAACAEYSEYLNATNYWKLEPHDSKERRAYLDKFKATTSGQRILEENKQFKELLAKVPIPPKAITWELGVKLLDELQEIALNPTNQTTE